MKRDKIAGGVLAGCVFIGAVAGMGRMMEKDKAASDRIKAEIAAETEARAEEETERATEAETERSGGYEARIFLTGITVPAHTITTEEETTPEAGTEMSLPTTTAEEITTAETTAETIPPQPSTAPTASETITEAEIPTEPETEPPASAVAARYNFTEEEKTYLVKTASSEAGNQGVYGMALIMRVVLNRAEQRGMSIHDVLYEPEQFNCVYGVWWAQDYRADGVYEALEMVTNGWDESYGATYFCTPQRNGWHMTHLQYLFQYGNMQFYREF